MSTVNLAQMISAIAQLRSMQTQGRVVDLQEKERKDKAGNELFSTLSAAPMEARASILEKYRNTVDSDVWNAANQFTGKMPESQEVQKNALARMGIPGEGAGRDAFAGNVANKEFLGNLTGQIKQSDFLGALTPGAGTFSDAMMKQWQQGMGERMATGRTQGQAAHEQAYIGLSPEQQRQQAMVEGGLAQSVPQIVNTQQQGLDREANMQGVFAGIRQRSEEAAGNQGVQMAQITGQLAIARGKTGMTPQQQGELMKQADDIAALMSKGTADEALQRLYTSQWNTYMDMLGMVTHKIKAGDDIPGKVGGWRALAHGVLSGMGIQ